MTTTATQRLTTVKAVERNLWRNRHAIGLNCPVLTAKAADGRHGRLYYIYASVAGPVTAKQADFGLRHLGFINIFENHPKAWCQGGIDRKTLIGWANKTFAA